MKYAPLEIPNTYNNFPIGLSQDMWGLWCALYYLCYSYHSFEKSNKLEILNRNYSLPKHKVEYLIFNEMIASLLNLNPQLRPSIQHILDEITVLVEIMSVILAEPVHLEN